MSGGGERLEEGHRGRGDLRGVVGDPLDVEFT